MKYITLIAFCGIAVLSVMSCATPFTQSLKYEYELSSDDIKQLQFRISDRIILQREVLDTDKEVTPGHTLKRVKGKLIEEVVFPRGTPCIAVNVHRNSLDIAFEPDTYLSFTTGNLNDEESRQATQFFPSRYYPWSDNRDGNKYHLSADWIGAAESSGWAGMVGGMSTSFGILAGFSLMFLGAEYYESGLLLLGSTILITGPSIGIWMLTEESNVNPYGNLKGKVNYETKSYETAAGFFSDSAFNTYLLVDEETLEQFKKESRVVKGIRLSDQ